MGCVLWINLSPYGGHPSSAGWVAALPTQGSKSAPRATQATDRARRRCVATREPVFEGDTRRARGTRQRFAHTWGVPPLSPDLIGALRTRHRWTEAEVHATTVKEKGVELLGSQLGFEHVEQGTRSVSSIRGEDALDDRVREGAA